MAFWRFFLQIENFRKGKIYICVVYFYIMGFIRRLFGLEDKKISENDPLYKFKGLVEEANQLQGIIRIYETLNVTLNKISGGLVDYVPTIIVSDNIPTLNFITHKSGIPSIKRGHIAIGITAKTEYELTRKHMVIACVINSVISQDMLPRNPANIQLIKETIESKKLDLERHFLRGVDSAISLFADKKIPVEKIPIQMNIHFEYNI